MFWFALAELFVCCAAMRCKPSVDRMLMAMPTLILVLILMQILVLTVRID